MKFLNELKKLFFGSSQDLKEDHAAIKCDACKVWYLRVRDILQAQKRWGLKNAVTTLLLFITMVLALTGHLQEMIGILFEFLPEAK